ncbi:MAG: hemolysin family protein [Acidobacteriia bacterium]|nr:hemolysin family protein [Terriglobia bacterium]
MAGYVLLRVFGVVLLVAANAFFVAAEFALVSVRDTRIQQLIDAGRVGARTVRKLHERMDELLSAVQLGVTLSSLGLGWLGEPTLAALIQMAMGRADHPTVLAHTVAVVLAFIVITYLHVVLGEVVPKSVTLQRPDRVALAVAAPMDFFITVARPFLRVISSSARFVLRRFGTHEIRSSVVHSPEELKLIVEASRRFGIVPQVEEEMILRALELGDITVRQVMVPRPRIFSLPADLPLEQALARVVEEQHSRVPVYDPQSGPEHIIGLLYSKDLTRWMRLRYSQPSSDPAAPRLARMVVRDIMRNVLVVPETKPLTDLLAEFRHRRRHLAVVVDEFGSTSGVVTVEDALEQLVGEIEDEFDITPQPLPAGATSMVLEGAVNIRDLETQHHVNLPSNQGFETLAGFMLANFQRIPNPADSFEFDGRRFTVLEMENRRIARVLIETLQPEAAQRAGD